MTFFYVDLFQIQFLINVKGKVLLHHCKGFTEKNKQKTKNTKCPPDGARVHRNKCSGG